MNTIRKASTARQTATCAGICLMGALSVVLLQTGMDGLRGDSGPDPDLLYFDSPAVVKKMALGYNSLLADIYWMRTIQYFGRREEADKRTVRYKNLYSLLDITTTLDPDLIDAYQAGSFFLEEPEPVGANEPGNAIRLLDKGIAAHPDNYMLRRDKGFVYYIYLHDFKAAGEVWLEASRRPEAPEWMAALAATAFTKGGSMDIARILWMQQYNEATRPAIKENARNHLLSLQVDEDLWTLEYLIGVYQLEHGRYPRSFAELAENNPRKFHTTDPLGTPYRYDPETGIADISPQSEIHYMEGSESYKEDFMSTLVQ
jgi:hypothetical protein